MMTVFYQPGSPVGLLLIMQVEEHVVFFCFVSVLSRL